MQYGEIIKSLRSEKNISQKLLGEMIGKSQSQMSELESGHTDCTPDDIVNICNALRVNVTRFYGASKFEHVIEKAESVGITPEELEKAVDLIYQMKHK